MFISILSKWSITLAKEQDILNILSMVKIFMRYLPPKPLSIDIWWHPTVHWLLQHVGECNPVCLCNSHLHCAMPAASQPPSVLKNGTEIYTKHLNSRIHHTFGLCLCKVFVSNNFSFFFLVILGKYTQVLFYFCIHFVQKCINQKTNYHGMLPSGLPSAPFYHLNSHWHLCLRASSPSARFIITGFGDLFLYYYN